MAMQEQKAYREFSQQYIPLWREWIIRLFCKRWGYDNQCLAYEFKGKLYILK